MSKVLNLKKILATASAYAMITGATSNVMANVNLVQGNTILRQGSNDGQLESFLDEGDVLRLEGNYNIINNTEVQFDQLDADNFTGTYTANADLKVTDNVDFGMTLNINGGKTTLMGGEISKPVTVSDNGLLSAPDTNVGSITLNTNNSGLNEIKDLNDLSWLNKGRLKMRNANEELTVDGEEVELEIENSKEILEISECKKVVATGSIQELSVLKGEVEVKTVETLSDIRGGNVKIEATKDLYVYGLDSPAVFVGKATGNIELDKNAKVSVSGDIGSIAKTDAGLGEGEVTLTGVGNITGAIGQTGVGNEVTKIIVENDRTFKHTDLFLTELEMKGDKAVLTLDNASIGGTKVTADGKQNIIVKADQNITGKIGTEAKPLDAIKVDLVNKVININTENFNSSVIGSNNLTGLLTTVDFKKDNAKAISLGTKENPLGTVKFTESATVSNGLYANKVEVSSGKTATLNEVIKVNKFQLNSATSKAIIKNDTTLSSTINDGVGTGGLVEFEGNISVKNMGSTGHSLTKVTFSDDAAKTAKLSGKIMSTDVLSRKSSIELTENAEIDATLTANSTPLIIADKTLTVKNFKPAGNGSIAFTAKGAESGKIVATNADYASVSKIMLIPTYDAKNAPTNGESITYKILENENASNILSSDKIEFEAGTVSGYKASVENNGDVIVTQTDRFAEIFIPMVSSVGGTKEDINNVNVIANAEFGTPAAEVRSDTINIYNNDDPERACEKLDRLAPLVTVADVIEDSMIETGRVISNHTLDLGINFMINTIPENMSGVSSGDGSEKFGAWFNPFFSNTKQKLRKSVAGYKSTAIGANIGIDTKINEDVIIGAALTAAKSDVKHKNYKSGDKSKINALLFSVYGMKQITDSWFTLGSITVGRNAVKNKSKKIFGATNEIAESKYTAISFSGEAMLGHNYRAKYATITPMFGARYTGINKNKYKTTGTTNQNQDITSKASNKFEIIAGARISGKTYDMNGLMVTPEIHGSIDHDLINKNGKHTSTLGGGNPIESRINKPIKTKYNVGLGISAQKGAMEYSANYDAQIADKHIGHTGSLTLRINF